MQKTKSACQYAKAEARFNFCASVVGEKPNLKFEWYCFRSCEKYINWANGYQYDKSKQLVRNETNCFTYKLEKQFNRQFEPYKSGYNYGCFRRNMGRAFRGDR